MIPLDRRVGALGVALADREYNMSIAINGRLRRWAAVHLRHTAFRWLCVLSSFVACGVWLLTCYIVVGG